MFHAAHGAGWFVRVLIEIVLFAALFGTLQLVPKQYRRHLILAITFIGGLYYALEFFLPVHPQPTAANAKATGNFLTPSMSSVSNWLAVIGAFTVGLGVINLSMVHGRRLTKGGNTAFNSSIFFISMVAMTVCGLLNTLRPNKINKDVFELLFSGALTTLDATMFSIVAFYIVSASYRAFRMKSTEATILLITAVIVMLGQVAIGQWSTSFNHSHNIILKLLHFEVVRDWILTLANTAAARAIGFGLGIGGLAVALRIWLGLERGSYFDGQS